jgi:tetratricopeptide (TPR) repeat protein/predicted Ser/Thr protein kinase
MIGTVLSNRYKLTAELGNGGMARVYLAEDLRDGKQVAVKVLYPQLGLDLSFLQRFMQEAKLVMSLSQSEPGAHVTQILDYGSDRDTHYLVMEYVEGRDLRQVLDEEGPLPWRKAMEIGRQVALALAYAHEHGIVHRDIKPENVMLLPDDTVRVLDFGVARARTSPTLTRSGFIGSPYYVAPEQAMGRAVDIRADLYSLGVVMYEMLAGQRPFESDTPWVIVNHHIATPPPLLEEVRPELPRPVTRLVQRALSKRPEDRYQTPTEMVQAIEAALEGVELPADSWAGEPDALNAILDGLYQRALQAAEVEDWQEAVDLFSQVLRLDPRYLDVTEQLAEAGRQARLSALYDTAQRSIKSGRWTQALAQLEEIAAVAPHYRDVQELQITARKEWKLQRAYQRGINRFEAADWPEAIESMAEVLELNPDHSKAAELLAAARGELQKKEESAGADAETQVTPAMPLWRKHRNLVWVAIAALILILGVGGPLLFRSLQAPVAILDTATPTRIPATSTPTSLPAVTRTPRPTLTAAPTLTATATPVAASAPRLVGQIAFPRYDTERSTYDVHVCRVDGSHCTRVVEEASQPDFLPSGDRLVVHSWKPDEKGISLQALSGERIWQITSLVESARPSVDFQGNAYVFISREVADRQPRLYRTQETEILPIKRGADVVQGLAPSWSPDGRILYSGCAGDQCGILVMNADGTDPKQAAAGGMEANPEASPDGQRVAFMSLRDGNWEIYVANLDGSGLRRLTDNPANDGLPAWSPDGRFIAFVSERDGNWAVWVMRADGTGQRRLFEIGGPLEGSIRGAASHEIQGWVEERISWAPLP